MTSGRLLTGVRGDGQPVLLTEHVARYGSLRLDTDLIASTLTSGLKGRGGGAFPTGEKLRAVAAQRGRPVVVLNGAEGEPASRKDKALLGAVPHLALDGAAVAAAALGAHEVVVAVGRAARRERAILASALKERRDPLRWRLAVVPDGFVSGEETALLSALAGRAPKPAVKPPHPFEHGLGGAPTLVQNAETLAQLALVARHGAGWFRSLGTEVEPGTALVTLSGAVARPGVYEIELGSTIDQLVAGAGGVTEPVSTFLVGGYFGGWTRDSGLALTPGSGLGAGVVVAFPDSACPLRESARVARYLAGESAGQCGPCLHGLAALAHGLEQLAAGDNGNRVQLARWAEEVAGRGACRHPDGAAAFVSSTLSVFEQETEDHLRGRCRRRDRGVLPVA
jgi:NADH:ubiquinone oxidoreductase subunit F (NADH-binding)